MESWGGSLPGLWSGREAQPCCPSLFNLCSSQFALGWYPTTRPVCKPANKIANKELCVFGCNQSRRWLGCIQKQLWAPEHMAFGKRRGESYSPGCPGHPALHPCSGHSGHQRQAWITQAEHLSTPLVLPKTHVEHWSYPAPWTQDWKPLQGAQQVTSTAGSDSQACFCSPSAATGRKRRPGAVCRA